MEDRKVAMNRLVEDNQNQDNSLALSVIVPVYNEKENIEPLVAEIRDVLDGVINYEIVYVDDGSSDGSLAKLKIMAEEIPCFRFVAHDGNFGQSAAVATGVNTARGELIATLDGDGQNDPADIPKLVDCLKAQVGGGRNNALVVGRRKKRRDNWLKRISSRIANGVRSRMLKDETPDTGSGLKVFTRSMFLALPLFDHMHRFLPALVMRHQGKVISVEVNHRLRRMGTSKYGLHNRLWIGIVDMFGVMWLQRRPIRPIIKDKIE
jgi:dolichol-phosphate mannosyltransferase